MDIRNLDKLISRTLFLVLLWFSITSHSRGAVSGDVQQDLQSWTTTLSQNFSSLLKLMNLDYYNNAFAQRSTYRIQQIDDTYGSNLAAVTKNYIESLVIAKTALVKKIREEAESSYAIFNGTHHECENNFFYYNKAKAIDWVGPSPAELNCSSLSYVPLSKDPLIFNLYDNRNTSTAHVPTNVYDGSSAIQNVANWSSSLDKIFLDNLNTDRSLKWQYFGSSTGYFKIFPGIMWYIQTSDAEEFPNKVDFFDCRSQPWYLQASAYPKDMVIVVDNSGSMKGRRHIIANHTVYEILNTLTDNDFFNILINGRWFNQTVRYVLPSINDRLIQATMRNKDTAIQSLSKLFQPKGIAEYDASITEAFRLLQNASSNITRSSNCTQALMIISDGAPESYDHIFKLYNKEEQVRVFTYIIGQEVTEAGPVRRMACNNRGFAVQISTLADVKENVQKYLDVVARTNAYGEHRFTIWTGVHSNQMEAGIPPEEEGSSSDDSSNLTSVAPPTTTTSIPTTSHMTTTFVTNNLTTPVPPVSVLHPVQPVKHGIVKSANFEMFTSVAQAVYDLTESAAENHEGILLGVAGLDVPVNDFKFKAPFWKLGVNAYMFTITNNGFIVFHPNFRPVKSHTLKAYYKNVDLAEVEIPAVDIEQGSKTDEHPGYELPLRTAMINRDIGSLTMETYVVPEPFKMGFKQTFKFFYTYVTNTSFSVGLAFPWTGNAGDNILNISLADVTKFQNIRVGDLTAFSDAMSQGCEKLKETFNDGVKISPSPFCEFEREWAHLFLEEPECVLSQLLLNPDLRASQKCDVEYLKLIYADAMGTQEARTRWNQSWTGHMDVKNSFGVSQSFAFHHSGLIRFFNTTVADDDTFIQTHILGVEDPLYKSTILAAKEYDYKNFVYFSPPKNDELKIQHENGKTATMPVTSVVSASDSPSSTAPAAVVGVLVSVQQITEMFKNVTGKCTGGAECVSCNSPDTTCYLIDDAGMIVVSTLDIRQVGLPLKRVDCSLMESLVENNVSAELTLYDYQGTCMHSQKSQDNFASRLFDPIGRLVGLMMTFVYNLGIILAEFTLSTLWASISAAIECNESIPTTPTVQQRINTNREYETRNCTHVYSAFNVAKSVSKQGNISCCACEKRWWAESINQTNLVLVVVMATAAPSTCQCPCKIPFRNGVEIKSNSSTVIPEPYRINPPWSCTPINTTENSTVCTSHGNRRSTISSMQSLVILGTWILSLLRLPTLYPV